LLAGCEATNYTVTIKNDSSIAVSYTYNGLSDTLTTTNKSKTYEVKAYTQPPIITMNETDKAKIQMIRQGGDYV